MLVAELLAALGWIAALFLALALTAIICDDYLVPSVEALCLKLSIPTEVAAATLLAFGSSAPDMVINSVGTITDDQSMSLSAVLGSAIICVGLIPSVSSFASENGLHLESASQIRNLVFVTFSFSALVFAMHDGKLSREENALLCILFVLYIAAVLLPVAYTKAREKNVATVLDRGLVIFEEHEDRDLSSCAGWTSLDDFCTPSTLRVGEHSRATDDLEPIACKTSDMAKSHSCTDLSRVRPAVSGLSATTDPLKRRASSTVAMATASSSENKLFRLVRQIPFPPIRPTLCLRMRIGTSRNGRTSNQNERTERSSLKSSKDFVDINGEGSRKMITDLSQGELSSSHEGSQVSRAVSLTSCKEILCTFVSFFFLDKKRITSMGLESDPEAKSAASPSDALAPKAPHLSAIILQSFLSLFYMFLLGYLILDISKQLSPYLFVSEDKEAVSILALGTQFPDLLASASLAREGFASAAVSNALGSLVISLTLGIGFPFLVQQIISGQEFTLLNADIAEFSAVLAVVIFAYLAVCLLTLCLGQSQTPTITKEGGAVLLLVYIAALIAVTANQD